MNKRPAQQSVHAIVNRSMSSIRSSSGESFRGEIHRYGKEFLLLFSSNMGLYGVDRTSRYPPQMFKRGSYTETCDQMMPLMRRLYACEPKREKILQALAQPLVNGKEQDAIIPPL